VRRRAARRLLIVSAACAAAAAPCAAQVEASLDASASVVRYDGYLAASAAALTPAFAWRSPRSALTASGSILVFQSGHTSLQGLLSGSTYTAPLGPLRLEGGAEAGASAYAGFARFAHALGRVRVHAFGARTGAWAGALAGRLSRGDGGRDALGGSAGVWARLPAGALEMTWTRLDVGDTSYTDLAGRARWTSGALEVAASAGARVASRGGGKGVYGDVAATLRIADGVSLIVAGGNYPSDPVRGSIPGRFVTAGVRLTPRSSPRAAWLRQLGPYFESRRSGSVDAPFAGVSVAVEQLDGIAILVVRVPAGGARRVEVMGDFTDWQPIALAPSGEGRYRFALGLPAGVHRFNLRVDGGPWGVPDGAGRAPDEFGGSVGVVVVP
jgi:hypothetical protein